VRDALAIHQLRDVDQRARSQLVPHAADDGSLLGHDDELAWMDDAASRVPLAAIAERT
jgi:hypothetical protein